MDSIRKESQRLCGGFGFHAPTAVSEHLQPSGEGAQAQLTRPLLVRYFLEEVLVVVWLSNWKAKFEVVSGI